MTSTCSVSLPPQAKALVKQQITEDRLKRAQKTAPVVSPTSKTVTAAPIKRDDLTTKACRVQVELACYM